MITISIVCHLFFSWIGFNPTDDGFILSLSRRILDGEIPHKDFIYIRPALSPVIHIPVVYFGGDLTFWFSRYFVWIELASTACIWTYIIAKAFFLIPFEKYLYFFLALTCFIFSVYSAFIMAHTTYDALFLYSLGLALCLRQSSKLILTGCFVIGLAYLCRQNFLILMPITLIILGYGKKKRYWIAAVLPGILYVIITLLLGSVNDLYFQIISVSGKFHGGLKIFITNFGFWLSIPAGYFLMLKFFVKDNQEGTAAKPNTRLFFTLVLIIIGILFLNSDIYPLYVSFFFFGLVFGAILYFLRVRNYEYFKYGLLILSVAWCTSISIGMSYPAPVSYTHLDVYKRQV